MDIDAVCTSSRGFHLGPKLPRGTILSAIPGGKIKELTTEALRITPPTYNPSVRRPHIYLLCGIPDISELVKSPNMEEYYYCESIYAEDPDDTFKRIAKALDKSQKDIKRHGALPIFATIPLYNIDKYNNHIKNTRRPPKTHHLHHTSEDYKIMQTNLEIIIDRLNKHIRHINADVGASTPLLHDTIKEYRGKKENKYFVYKWNRMYDGLHPGDDLLGKWGSVLERCFTLNRERDSLQEQGSPKRSWKRTRFSD